MSILIAIIAFCIIILVHELGHFLAAKACGIKVNEFALGMGPIIFKFQGKETRYSIRILPIGGSCQMEGEDSSSDNERAFRNKAVWQRLIVVFAGAFMNLVLGLIIVLISVISGGKIYTTIIDSFKTQPTSNQYLQENDKILKINGMSVYSVMDLNYQFTNDKDGLFSMEILRDGKKIKLDEVPFLITVDENGNQSLYFDFYIKAQKVSISNVFPAAFGNFASTARLIWITLIDLVKGNYGINDLSGPVGVVNAIDQVSKMGLSTLLGMIAFISINVGIFNLLPIPALDGSRAVFLLIEGVRRKPIKAEFEGYIHFAGFALLMLLMLVVTFNDIKRIITGG